MYTKAEDLTDIRKIFQMFDTNKDGFLTIEELRSGFAELAYILRTDEADIEDLLQKKC